MNITTIMSSQTSKSISSSSPAVTRNLKAAVLSASSGIGQACARRLAQQGYTVLAIAREEKGSGDRGSAILKDLAQYSKSNKSSNNNSGDEDSNKNAAPPRHEFYPLNAFSLKEVHRVAQEISSKHPVIDALVLTQGMATTQGFTPTPEGNDEKMTLHYFSRVAMVMGLLPSLRQSCAQEGGDNLMKKGPVVISILSGGVHSVYDKMYEDFSLEKHYSLKNAADAAGYYNDLALDVLARDEKNQGINFVHASPGFVNSTWGKELNPVLRGMVRVLQPLGGRKPLNCAEYMLGPTVFASQRGDDLPRTLNVTSSFPDEGGVIVMGQNGQPKSLTKGHTKEAREFLWEQTLKVLNRAWGVVDGGSSA